MLIDFRKAPTVIPDLFIDAIQVERVTEYKYLRQQAEFNKNTDFIHKRCQPRIFCLRKPRSLNVSAAVLCTFCRSCIESVLTFLFLCWFVGLNVKSKSVLNKVVNVCGKVVGERQEQLSQFYEWPVVQKARVIVDDNSCVLAKHYDLLPFGRRSRVPKSNTVSSISKQINPFKRQSNVCVCVCVNYINY